ncbi:MAG: glycosyltransferase [Dermatophilaceae bacterium]
MSAVPSATRAALGRVRDAPTILDAVDAFDAVGEAASHDGCRASEDLVAAIDDRDPLVSIAAVHAAAVAHPHVAESLLVPLLGDERRHLREHAAWALATSRPIRAAEGPLREMVEEGGFAGTLAGVTLERWVDEPAHAGLIPAAEEPLRSGGRGRGLTVAQLYLHGEIDGSLSNAGRGDTGGIATLLVRLGDALLKEPGIERVLTLSREAQADDSPQTGSDDAVPGETATGPGHHYLGIPVPRPAPPASRSWTLRTPALEGLRRQLRAAGRVDVLHLRMADVGSWAGAQVARELGIPVVLTLAPDPHALLAAREAAGTLTRETFAEADLAEHLVFRIRLLRDLRDQAAALVTFPRPQLERDLRRLLHLDPGHDVHVVPEGIDVEALDEADRHVAAALEGGRPSHTVEQALDDLDALLQTLPPHRRGLPLVLSVGRLHPVKGMATLARAWAENPALSSRCNLVIVGGDLRRPTSDEAGQLDLLDEVVPCDTGPDCGLLLAGHRTNPTVAAWLSAVRRGRPGLSAPNGVYACASLKEEFGIALCEALGSGLVVVAPNDGGPPTYIEDGVTGLLVDTADPVALGGAVAAALDLASEPDTDARAAHARRVVLDRFSITTMAQALAPVYADVACEKVAG